MGRYGKTRMNDDEYPVVLEGIERSVQKNFHECGARCTFMVLKYYGKVRSYNKVYDDLHRTDGGITPASMKRLIREKGLTAGEFDGRGIDKLKKSIDMGAPIIAWIYRELNIKVERISINHWVVVYGYDRGNIWVMDPNPLAIRKRIPIKSFKKKWSGGGIVVRRKKGK